MATRQQQIRREIAEIHNEIKLTRKEDEEIQHRLKTLYARNKILYTELVFENRKLTKQLENERNIRK